MAEGEGTGVRPVRAGGLSRRAVLALGGGLAGAARGASPAKAFDEPPLFRTARHQFTLLEPQVDWPAPTLVDLDGRPTRVVAPRGKVLLVNGWATWCDACRVELPWRGRLHAEAPAGTAIAAISVDRGVPGPRLRQFLKGLGAAALPVAVDPGGRALEAVLPLASVGIPVTLLVTPAGRVAGYMAGVADWGTDEGRRLIAYYLAA